MAGAARPARLARQFCKPVHFPAAMGPAMVCAIAQWLEANMPYDAQANIRQAIEATSPCTTATNTIEVARPSPVIAQVLRTRVGVAPAMIARSASTPVMMVVIPVTQKASPPTPAMADMENPRSLTRYEGNQV